MGWLRRLTGRETAPEYTRAVERASPALKALFSGVSEDGSHSVLDLGPASESSLRLYGRFAQHVRFADLRASADTAEGWAEAMGSLPARPDAPYDLVLGWDILDRLPKAERRGLMERLTALTSTNARLYLVVDASERKTLEPLRFTLMDVDRIRYEPVGPPQPAPPRLLPAEVERLLAPFQVVSGFTLKVGVREYVAARRGR